MTLKNTEQLFSKLNEKEKEDLLKRGFWKGGVKMNKKERKIVKSIKLQEKKMKKLANKQARSRWYR